MAKHPICKKCKKELRWKMPYVQGERPYDWELTGGKTTYTQPHDCSPQKKVWDKYMGREYSEIFWKKWGDHTVKCDEPNCIECGGSYTLRYPCNRHIPDGYRFKTRREEYERRKKS